MCVEFGHAAHEHVVRPPYELCPDPQCRVARQPSLACAKPMGADLGCGRARAKCALR